MAILVCCIFANVYEARWYQNKWLTSNILETKRVPSEEAVRIQVDKYIILEWLSTYYHSSKGQ